MFHIVRFLLHVPTSLWMFKEPEVAKSGAHPFWPADVRQTCLMVDGFPSQLRPRKPFLICQANIESSPSILDPY